MLRYCVWRVIQVLPGTRPKRQTSQFRAEIRHPRQNLPCLTGQFPMARVVVIPIF